MEIARLDKRLGWLYAEGRVKKIESVTLGLAIFHFEASIEWLGGSKKGDGRTEMLIRLGELLEERARRARGDGMGRANDLRFAFDSYADALEGLETDYNHSMRMHARILDLWGRGAGELRQAIQ